MSTNIHDLVSPVDYPIGRTDKQTNRRNGYQTSERTWLRITWRQQQKKVDVRARWAEALGRGGYYLVDQSQSAKQKYIPTGIEAARDRKIKIRLLICLRRKSCVCYELVSHSLFLSIQCWPRPGCSLVWSRLGRAAVWTNVSVLELTDWHEIMRIEIYSLDSFRKSAKYLQSSRIGES